MKRTVAVLITLIVLVLAGWYLFARSSKSTTNDMSAISPRPSTSVTTSPTSSNNAAATANAVTIQNFAFGPTAITVKKGTAVTWTNKDNATHTVTETDGKTGPMSGSLANGATFAFTYNTVGTFAYHCSIHTSMVGTVTVTE